MLRDGLRAQSGAVHVVWQRSVPTSSEVPRVGFAVSRRVGNAVVRNRTRRRLRQICRDSGHLHGGAYLIRVQPEAATLPYAELAQNVDRALIRVQRPHQPGGGE